MPNNPTPESNLAAFIADFDREMDEELEQLQQNLNAASMSLGIELGGVAPTFEQQFAADLEMDRQAELSYLESVPTAEVAKAELEKIIQETRLPTFEDMFTEDLEKDRQAEQAWMDSIDAVTSESIEQQFAEIRRQSRKWHNLVRARDANILLHIVDSNYSEQNYRQLLDVPEFADSKYIPIYNPDDASLLSVTLDFSEPNVVKINTAGDFIELAQTKQFTLETPHALAIDELHVKALTVKDFAQIYKPKSHITLQDFIDLSAKGPIVVGKVLAGNQIQLYSPSKIAASLLRAVNIELHSLSDVKLKEILAQRGLKAIAERIDIKQATSLDKLYFASKSLLAERIAAVSVSLKCNKIAAEQIIGVNRVDIKGSRVKVKLIVSQTKEFEPDKENLNPDQNNILPDPIQLYSKLHQHYTISKPELAAEFKYAIISGELSGNTGGILAQLSINEPRSELAKATKKVLQSMHQLAKPYLAEGTDKLMINIDELAGSALEFIDAWVTGDIHVAKQALEKLQHKKQSEHKTQQGVPKKSAGKINVNCQTSFEVDRIQAVDCHLKVGTCAYKSDTFKGVANNLTLELQRSFALTTRLNANQLRLVHLKVEEPLLLDEVLDIQHKLIIEAMALRQNKAICAGSFDATIHNRFESNAPIAAKDIAIQASVMRQSQNGNIQGEVLKVNISEGYLQGRALVKTLQLNATTRMQYNPDKWQADNYEISVPAPCYAAFPTRDVPCNYTLSITNPRARGQKLSIPQMRLGGQLTINAEPCTILIVRAKQIVAKFIMMNGQRISLSNSGLFGLNGINLSARDGFAGLNDGAYIRTMQGDIKLISEGGKIDLAYLEILAMLSGNIFLRARDGVEDIAGRLQTVHGDVIVQSPSFLMGLMYHQLQSESRGNNLTRTGGVRVTSRASELVARRLLLNGFNPGESCVARLVGSMCYLQELPQNNEAIQTQSITDHENFHRTWTYEVEVGRSRRRYIICGPRAPIIENRRGREDTTTTHATYTAELVTHDSAHVNLTPEDHSGLILSAGQNTIRFDKGTVFNPTPQSANYVPFLNVGLDEVMPSSGGFYVPRLGNRYSFYSPVVNIPYEEKHPMIAGIDRHGILQIMPRRSVWMYHHLGQELENFHLILHKQYAASVSNMPNPEELYWQACLNGAAAINALQAKYAGESISFKNLDAELTAGEKYVVFYQEQLEPTTTKYAWFMRAVMPCKMYELLRDNFGVSGIYGENVLLCGVDSQASIKLRDDIKAKALLDMQKGDVELIENKVKAQNITANLSSLNIDDAEVAATVDVGIAAEFLRIARNSEVKTNVRAGHNVGLKAGQFTGVAASIAAGNDLTTLFVQSEDLAKPIQTSNGAEIHLLPKLYAGNAMLWQVAGKSQHQASQIKAKRFKEVAEEAVYLAVTDVQQKTWTTQEKSGSGLFKSKKDVQHFSIDAISRGATFDVEGAVEIMAENGISLQQVKSTAAQNTFVASNATVELLAGTHQHHYETQSHKRNLVWQKHQHDTTKSTNHTPCQFDGPVDRSSQSVGGKVKIVARSAYLQLLANDVMSQCLKGQVEEGLEAELAIQYLHAAYEHHCEKQQGPTAAATALIALAIAAVTYGTAGGWLGVGASTAPTGAAAAGGATATSNSMLASMGAKLGWTTTSVATATTSLTTIGSVAAAMIDAALCSTMTTVTSALANNNFDIGKAIKELGKSENIRSLLTSMAASGITAGFIEPLKQSKSGLDVVLQVERTADLLTKVERGLLKAGVQYGASQLIEKGEHRTKFAASLGGAIAGAVADHLDFGVSTKQLNQQISTIEAKISKAVIGGLGASIVSGKRAFLGGALGALVADLDILALEESKLNPQEIGRHAKATELLAGFGSLLLKQDVNAAAKSAGRVAENRAYARVLYNKLQDISLAKEAMLARAKELLNRGEDGEDDVQDLNLQELLRDSGLSEENIDELEKLITEQNKAAIKATMQTEQDDNQDLGEASEQNDAFLPDANLPPPSDGPPNPPDSGARHEQSAGSSNATPGTENQQARSASSDKDDKTEQKNAVNPGLLFSRDSKENIALQKTCKTIAGTLEPHVDRIGKFVEEHPYAMDAINLVMLTAAFSAGGIPGVVMMSLKSSIALAGEDAAKDELVSRGVAAKDAAIVVGAIALSLGAKGMVKGAVGLTKQFAGKVTGWFRKLGAAKDRVRNNFNISPELRQQKFTPAFDQIASFSTKTTLDGALYPKNKLTSLVKYLEKRGVHVYPTEYTVDPNPRMLARRDGVVQIYLPSNPTVLQVKHELSHWLDLKRLGYENYSKLTRFEREHMVLERLQSNRVWKDLNSLEQEFSKSYVESLADKIKWSNKIE